MKIGALLCQGDALCPATIFDAVYDPLSKKTLTTVLAEIGASVGSIPAYSFVDKNATLAWGTRMTIATIGGVDIHLTMPANPNTNLITSVVGKTGSVTVQQIADALTGAGYKLTDTYTWAEIGGKPSVFTPAGHNHASSNITNLSGYSKATTVAAISASDTLNVALGKLERALDGKQAAGSYLTGITGAMVTSALGYTPCNTNDARLSNARSASDVYAWAKASAKPSYTWAEIGGKPSVFTPAGHNHASSNITNLSGYSKATTVAAISASDTLNVALGKLERALDGKQAAGSYLTGITGAMVTSALGYTPCNTNDARLSNARSASDVYAWAKASAKPSYTWAEIGGKPSVFTPAGHTHDYLPLAGGTINGSVVVSGSVTSYGNAGLSGFQAYQEMSGSNRKVGVVMDPSAESAFGKLGSGSDYLSLNCLSDKSSHINFPAGGTLYVKPSDRTDAQAGYFRGSDGKWYNPSDRRLKTSIAKPSAAELERIFAWAVAEGFKNFTWINGNRNDFGVIAQEVSGVMPAAVDHNSHTDTYYVNYEQLHSRLLAAVIHELYQLEQFIHKN